MDKKGDEPSKDRKDAVREARKLFPALFFGWDDGKRDDKEHGQPSSASKSTDAEAKSSVSSTERRNKTLQNKESKLSAEETHQNQPMAAAEKASELIASLITKKNGKELRESWFFTETYKQALWQRDAYFIGPEYANWSRRRRQREQSSDTRSVKAYLTLMPYDDSLASQQLAKIAADFIPTETVKQALLPIVLALPKGALYGTTQTALVDIIRSQQSTLDQVVKNSLIYFLDDPTNRQNIKNTTKGFISQFDKD
ncbi:hypothetical protein MPSEU_000086900 [Mayamaea pseudoterrestris]|nr:hypothetical protein MPSEU_000086900 [Mayamaea pseudoterrestris]